MASGGSRLHRANAKSENTRRQNKHIVAHPERASDTMVLPIRALMLRASVSGVTPMALEDAQELTPTFAKRFAAGEQLQDPFALSYFAAMDVDGDLEAYFKDEVEDLLDPHRTHYDIPPVRPLVLPVGGTNLVYAMEWKSERVETQDQTRLLLIASRTKRIDYRTKEEERPAKWKTNYKELFTKDSPSTIHPILKNRPLSVLGLGPVNVNLKAEPAAAPDHVVVKVSHPTPLEADTIVRVAMLHRSSQRDRHDFTLTREVVLRAENPTVKVDLPLPEFEFGRLEVYC